MMTIYICGDSISASYGPDRAPMTGWGQLLSCYTGSVKVDNQAFPGRSARSFLNEGRLQKIEKELRPGDLMLIQFTHNDESPLLWRYAAPRTFFTDALTVYIDTAREYGAVPVLLTPVCMRNFVNGKLKNTHGDYPLAMEELADKTGTACLDMYGFSFHQVQELGEEGSKNFFLHTDKGAYPAFPEGSSDNAHLKYTGADILARWTAQELKALKLIPEGKKK